MANISIDIEQVVREVMAQLGLAAPPRADSPQPQPSPAKPDGPPSSPPQAAAPSPGELAVSSRVVTLAELDGRLTNGVRRVMVPQRAIVTTAVRDELRRRNVELVYGQPKSNGAPQAAAAALPVVIHGNPSDAEALTKALGGAGIPIELHSTDCIFAAMDHLTKRLAGGAPLGVLLTRHTAAAVCLANRLAGVRAILGLDPAAVAGDAAAVGANLLVVDPARHGLFRAKQIIGQFYRQGPQDCPKVFQKRLQ